MRRNAFTLTELIVSIGVIAILSSSLVFAMYGQMEAARVARARTAVYDIASRTNDLWDAYRTRPVRLLSASGSGLPVSVRRNSMLMAAGRLNSIRDLQRMELPDRITDVCDGPLRTPTTPVVFSYGGVSLAVTKPSVSDQYWRYADNHARKPIPPPPVPLPAGWVPPPVAYGVEHWKETFEGAECLWMILKFNPTDGQPSRHVALERSIDVDDDGMPEIADPWGNPVEWLRWAPGYGDSPGIDGAWGVYQDDNGNEVDDDGTGILQGYGEAHWAGSDDAQTLTVMVKDSQSSPDPFNPMRISYPSGPDEQPRGFALHPLIYSAGADGEYEINKLDGLAYRDLAIPCDPYHNPAGAMVYQVGTPLDIDQNGELGFIDNITSHYLPTR